MCTHLSVFSRHSVSMCRRNVDCYYKECFASMKNWIHKYRSQHSSYYTFKRRPFQPDEVSQTWVLMLAQVLQEGIVTQAKSKANLEQAGKHQLEVKNEEKNEALDEISPAQPSRTQSHAYSRCTRSTWVHLVCLTLVLIETFQHTFILLCPTTTHQLLEAYRFLFWAAAPRCPA